MPAQLILAVKLPPPNPASFTASRKVVSAAGTGEQLPSCEVPEGCSVAIKAEAGNTGEIYVAKSKANSETAGQRFPLPAGGTLDLKVANANAIWINSSVDGEGVEYAVEED